MPVARTHLPSAPTLASWMCPVCDYDLASRPVGSPCPECGTPIAPLTDATDTLDNAPRSYLARILLGARLVWAGLLLIPLFVVAGVRTTNVTTLVLTLIGTVLAGAWFAGVWLITTPRPPLPSRSHLASWGRPSLITRVVAGAWPLLFLAATLVQAPYVLGLSASPPFPNGIPTLISIAAFTLIFAALAAFPVLLLFTARIADWSTDHDLATRLRTLATTHAIMYALLGATAVLTLLGLLPQLILFFLVLQGAAWVIVTIMSIVAFRAIHAVIAWAPRVAAQSRQRTARSLTRVAERLAALEAKPQSGEGPTRPGVGSAPTHSPSSTPGPASATAESNLIDLAPIDLAPPTDSARAKPPS